MAYFLILACALLAASEQKSLPTTEENLLLPGVQPKVKDTYLCMARKLNSTPLYIVGFKPHSDSMKAHHMLLFGCEEPGFTDRVWSCGEMDNKADHGYDNAHTCLKKYNIIYAWGMDAKSLPLPKDVAFKVGGHTNMKYLVLQVHYKNVTMFTGQHSEKDYSGVTLTTSITALPKRAGVYLMGTDGSIPPKSTVYMETACPYYDRLTIHPFAFRGHTHVHGKVVAGYRIRHGRWTEIGRIDPRLPQMFYDTTTPKLDISAGDILAARCTMVNNEKREVEIGATQNDEMCNFYIMYWVDDGVLPTVNTCFTPGPPSWSWARSELSDAMNLENAPADISTKPSSGETYLETNPDDRMYSLDPAKFSEFGDQFAEEPYYQQEYPRSASEYRSPPWYERMDDDEPYVLN